MSFLAETAIFLGAAVIAVPLSKRIGLGAVLGYLAAGLAIGPAGAGLVTDVERILHFAEIGVVLLLFVIGLELQPTRLWGMRKAVFGWGAAQVAATGLLLAAAAMAFGVAPASAVIVGLSLALSSTAFALQHLAERNQLTTRFGRASFSILLFQDLAAIPLIAVVPLLGAAGTAKGDGVSLVAAAEMAGVLIAVVVGGKYLLHPVYRLVAATRLRELFTAAALLTVLGISLLVDAVGLSMALGAFVAGVLLADSEFRHELEADIEPFKGLLLGLFFIAVGMSVDLGLLVEETAVVAALVVGLVAVKAAVLFGLGRAVGLGAGSAKSLAIAISQGGEFAFVVFTAAVGAEVVERGLADLLILVVTVSMGLTPVLAALDGAAARWRRAAREEADYEVPRGEDNQVIIAGFGRVGQMVGRLLRAKRIGFTALEMSAAQVDFVRKFGNRVHYGDASRLDLLHAANADKADIFVLAIDDVEESVRTAETVTRHFPHLTVFARARNRQHAYRLMDLGVAHVSRETFLSSLDMARQVLCGLGLSAFESDKAVRVFRENDEARLHAQHAHYRDEEKFARFAREWAAELEEQFEQDAKELPG